MKLKMPIIDHWNSNWSAEDSKQNFTDICSDRTQADDELPSAAMRRASK